MSLLLQSEAQFSSHAREVGLNEQVVNSLRQAGAGSFKVGLLSRPARATNISAGC